MAFGNDEQLNIIIRARDEATKTLNSVQGRVKSMEPTFRKMAVVGTAAFAAITAGAGLAVKEAALAEGAYNKFNTVFGEHADDMLAFVSDIRQTMPSATHEIVRMAADLQDLLVPMGIARNEAADMTKGFVTLANQLAAFNDVAPTEVLEAFKSGLAGSSEPLRRFGINALESSIELEALNTGLLEAGSKLTDLDPITRSQVRAQALLSLAVKQSSDAISGFEANNDSLLRRTQDLQATWLEMKVTLGTALIPVIDSLVKKLSPVIESIAEWIEQHPELARNIVIVAAALAGLVAVLGVLGIAFLAINPISIVIVGAITAIGLAIYGITNALHQFGFTWRDVWAGAKAVLSTYVDSFKLIINNMIGAVEAYANAWVEATNVIVRALNRIQVRIPDWVPGIGGNSFGINLPEVEKISLPRFEHGGIVPGPTGSPVPIIAHGQERLIPASQVSSSTGHTFVVNINNPQLRDRSDISIVKRELEQALRSVVRNNKLQTL